MESKKSFLPNSAAEPLEFNGLAQLSDLVQCMPVDNKGKAGLLATNEFRTAVDKLPKDLFSGTMALLEDYKETRDPELAQEIANVSFFAHWAKQGYLFEPCIHNEGHASERLPEPLSQIVAASNAALGRLQNEFVYDVYTLSNGTTDKLNLEINYKRPKAIIAEIRKIQKVAGFLDIEGGKPEHNFQHNHTFMEMQMKKAFDGFEKLMAGNKKEGWTLINEAATNAHAIFKTMPIDTPPESYPRIRLPIQGTLGKLGGVYGKQGVFYEGCGTDLFDTKSSKTGMWIGDEFGQTGANSSMYKWFDVILGVAEKRNAYTPNSDQLTKMEAVFKGNLHASELGDNPIDSMQRAFDLLTRPSSHMNHLVESSQRMEASKLLLSKDPIDLMGRLRLAKSVYAHRVTHLSYVNSFIHKQKPIAGQSRAQGTGGSTPNFLKTFGDQTLEIATSLIQTLKECDISPDMRKEVFDIEAHLGEQAEKIQAFHDKGLELQKEEETERLTK